MSIKLRRMIAYIFDIMAISLISSALSMSSLNPNIDKIESLTSGYTERVESLNNDISELDSEKDSEKIDKLSKEFYEYYEGYLYKQTRLSIFEGIVTVSSIILYYVVFALFFGGETVGKRLMKIKVVNRDGKSVGFVNLLLRTIILYRMIITILNITFSYVFGLKNFLTSYNILYYVSMGIEMAIILMTLIRKDGRGLHDVVAGTKVIDIKET